MKDTDIFFSIALMILGIVLMYKSMKVIHADKYWQNSQIP